MNKKFPRHLSTQTPVEIPSPWRHLTRIAFTLLVAIVIARLTTLESLREPWDVSPGGQAISRGPGPGTGLVFDLLALLPALLVLTRRTLDPAYRLTARWSFLPMLLLGGWAVLSTTWSADKFAAIITASHFLAGLCLLWTAAQLVRDWMHFRVVAAICFGLLLVLVAQSVMYRFLDVPDNIEYWNQYESEILAEHHWEPDSFAATQFEKNLVKGELPGFFNSANTFAAVGVMFFAVSAGIGLQKWKDGDGPEWLGITGVAIVSLIWILIEARSKTAAATPVLGCIMLAAVTMLRSRFRQHSSRYYWIGVVVFLFCATALVGHGLYHSGLFPGHFSNSLEFRWQYWTASANMFHRHPIIGVGWNNFGQFYLVDRLPSAAEEIKDPHNFIVRIFVELGIVGGLLLIAWMLRLWWELTRPSTTSQDISPHTHRATVAWVATIAVSGIVLSIIAGIDFMQIPWAVAMELLRRLLYLLVLLLGAVAGSMLSPHRNDLDDRPAPWIVYCALIGIGLFLIHNLIDFSLWETGPMFVFLLLTGSALGIASPPTIHWHPSHPLPPGIPSHHRRGLAMLGLAGAAIAWLFVAGTFVAPVIYAEQSAHDSDEAIRTIDKNTFPQEAQSHYTQAIDEMQAALAAVPYNCDYAFRLGRLFIMAGKATQARDELQWATHLNPRYIDAYLLLANMELSKPAPIAAEVMENVDAALRLNPNDASLHDQYARSLQRLDIGNLARQQYEKALECNDALPPEEPRRFPPEQIAEIQNQIKSLPLQEEEN